MAEKHSTCRPSNLQIFQDSSFIIHAKRSSFHGGGEIASGYRPRNDENYSMFSISIIIISIDKPQ